MSATLFTNAKVIDGSGEAAFQGDVLVEGNRIKTVAREVGAIAANGADVVDCGGATLMPGMVCAHCHITFANTSTLEALGEIPTEEHVLLSARNAKDLSRLRLHQHQFHGLGQVSAGRRHPQRHQRRRYSRPAHAGRHAGADGQQRPRRRAPAAHEARQLRDHLRRRRRVPPRGAGDGPRGRRHPEDQPVRRRVRAPCQGRAHGDDRGGDRRRRPGRPRRRPAHRRPCPQRQLGETLSQARHPVDQPRHFRGRRGARHAGGGQGLVLRDADPGDHLRHGLRGRRLGHHAGGRRADRHAARVPARGREHEGSEEARRPGAARRRLRLRLEPHPPTTPATWP